MASNSARGGGEAPGRRRAPLVARRPADAKPAPRPSTSPAPPPSPPRDPPGLRDDDGAWMSSRQAAEAAGVSLDVVRQWRKAGTIAERGKGARLQVFLTADHRQAAAPSAANGVPHSELGVLVPLEIHQRSLAELILRLTDTTERAVRAETELEFLRERLAELERSL